MRRLFRFFVIISFSLLSLNMTAPLRSLRAECPTVIVDCPPHFIEPGVPFRVVANVSGADPKPNLSYHWSIFGGTIISGQGTASITVESSRPHCQTFTASVEVAGLDSGCQHSAACSMVWEIPVSRKFDQYGDMDSVDERARLDNFAAQLKREPNSRGYIVFYNDRRATARKAQLRANRERTYLMRANRIDGKRIIAVSGGQRDEPTLELWIAPQRAPAPPDFKSELPKCY